MAELDDWWTNWTIGRLDEWGTMDVGRMGPGGLPPPRSSNMYHYSSPEKLYAFLIHLHSKMRKVSEQPASGVLFKSANMSTWEPDQMEDIKFTLKKAVFDTSATGTVTLSNATLSSRTLGANPLRTFNGTGIIRVFHKNHGMHSTSDNVTISGVASGTYNGIAHSAINGTYTSIKNITLDSYDINPSNNTSYSGSIANPTSAGDIGGTAVTATQNRLYDVLNLSLQTMTVPGTNIGYSIRPTTGKSLSGSETEFQLTSANSAVNVVANDNIYFTAPQMVASDINQTNEMSGQKSLFVQLDFSSSKESKK